MIAAKRATALAALCCTTAVLVGCTQSMTGVAAPGPAAPGEVDLSRFYDQQLSWGPCAEFGTSAADRDAFADAAFDCARLEVPLVYASPEGETAQIGVLRRKAPAGTARIGSLVTNPGGPGVSGMSRLASTIVPGADLTPLAGRFDLVGFDPRGVGASTPTIQCLDDQEWETDRRDVDVDPSPAGVEATEAENREYAQRCTERSGGAEVLSNVGTRDVVRDLDILRAALGDEKLTYLGYSYGTRIGAVYAEEFPQNVRALVLDGALDPTETTVDRTVKQNAGFQLAFDAFAADCARRPTCPLGTDPAAATAAFQALTRPLIDEPMPVGPRTLSYPDALIGSIQALYAKDFWPILTRGLSGLATGDGRILLALGDLYYDRGEDGVYGNSNEAFVAISCVDEQRLTDRAQAGELERLADEAAPFRDDGRGPVAALDACGFWPSPPTSEPHVPAVDGLPPTLTISVTGDPATPYQAGVDLAAALGGRLLSVDGNQHTSALQRHACVDDVVSAYLIDLAVPAADARCAL